MYKVLYRKYRPRFFSDVVGQSQITTTLSNELQNNRISHAYLFTGTRGTGKTTCAKIFAKAVNCLNPENGDACGTCKICCSADNDTLLDIMEIDAASNNGIDSIRTLIEEANFTPTVAKYRVYIIDEVHMLTVAAFNALLKTLEEPPAHVIFILATTEVHRLLPTILSRCQRFDFRRISPDDVAARLLYIASQESAHLEYNAALLIAQITDGTMRDAISILDQCLSRAGDVTEEVVSETAGIANRDYLISLANAVISSDAPAAIELLDVLYKNSKDMVRLCEEMTEYFRGLMLTKTMKKPEKILNRSAKELDEMKLQIVQLELSVILHALSVFEEAQGRMRYGNARTEMEMSFVKLCRPTLDSSIESVLRRIETLEQRKYELTPSVVGKSSLPDHESYEDVPISPSDLEAIIGKLEALRDIKGENTDTSPMSSDSPKKRTEIASSYEMPPTASSRQSIEELSKSAVIFSDWSEILEQIKRYSRSVAAAFGGSTAYVQGDYMLIDAPKLAFDLLKRQSQREQIRDVIRQATGKVYKLGPYKKSEMQVESEQDSLDVLALHAQEAGIKVVDRGEITVRASQVEIEESQGG